MTTLVVARLSTPPAGHDRRRVALAGGYWVLPWLDQDVLHPGRPR